MGENAHRWFGHAIAVAGILLMIWIKLDIAELRGAVETLTEVVTTHVNMPNLHAAAK